MLLISSNVYYRIVFVSLYVVICEVSLQNPQNVATNEMVVILDYNLISLNKL